MTLAERNPSPTGVVMGPLRAVPRRRIDWSTGSGTAVPYLAITSPPASTRSHSIFTPAASMTRTAASVTSGPIPSPGSSVTSCVVWLDMAGPASYVAPPP